MCIYMYILYFNFTLLDNNEKGKTFWRWHQNIATDQNTARHFIRVIILCDKRRLSVPAECVVSTSNKQLLTFVTQNTDPIFNKRKFTFPTLSVTEADFRDVLTNPTCNFLFLLIVFFLDIRVPRSVVIRVRGVFRHLVRIIQHLQAGQRAEPPHAARRRQRPVWRFLVQTVIVVVFVCIVFLAAVLEERGGKYS